MRLGTLNFNNNRATITETMLEPNHNSRADKFMDPRLIFAMIAFLGGLWIYLQRAILDGTAAAPADYLLLPLAFSHFVVLVYLLLTLAIFFWQGMATSGYPEPPISRHVSRLLLSTWPITLVALCISYVTAKLGIHDAFKSMFIVVPLTGVTFAGLAYWSVQRAELTPDFPHRRWFIELIAFSFAIVVAFVPYMAVMSYVFSDVTVTTDKEVYVEGDLTVTIRRAGYVICPTISAIECGKVRQKLTTDGAYTLPLSAIGHGDYILVEYLPQMSSEVRRHFEPVMIARRLE
jgi:hypothetical protein